MPFINTKTTAKLDTGATERLTKELGRAIELIPGKTEKWLMLNFEGECKMAFAGAMGDCCLVEVELLGSATDEAYDAMTKEITAIISKETKIPSNRIYVKYEEISHWGFDGFNF